MALRRNRGDEPLDDGHDGLSSTLVPNKPLKDVQSRGFARVFMVVLVAGYVAIFFYFRTITSKRDDETRTAVHTLESSFAKVQDEMKQMATELEERKRMLEEKQKGDGAKGERLTSTLPYPEAGTISPVSRTRWPARDPSCHADALIAKLENKIKAFAKVEDRLQEVRFA